MLNTYNEVKGLNCMVYFADIIITMVFDYGFTSLKMAGCCFFLRSVGNSCSAYKVKTKHQTAR